MRHGCLQPGRKGGAPQRKWQEMSSARKFFNLSFLSYISAYVQLQSPPGEINSSPAVRYMRLITAFLLFSLVPSLLWNFSSVSMGVQRERAGLCVVNVRVSKCQQREQVSYVIIYTIVRILTKCDILIFLISDIITFALLQASVIQRPWGTILQHLKIRGTQKCLNVQTVIIIHSGLSLCHTGKSAIHMYGQILCRKICSHYQIYMGTFTKIGTK